MLKEDLDDVIKQMKNVTNLENNLHNQQEQLRTDTQFKNCVTALYKDYITYSQAKEGLNYELNDDTKDSFSDVLDTLGDCIVNGLAVETQVNSSRGKTTRLENSLRTEWAQFYTMITSKPKGQLEIGKGLLETEEYKKHSLQIDKGKSWSELALPYNDGKTVLERFIESINFSTSLLNQMNITPNIRKFLKKVGEGKATIYDLDDEVIKWIRDEQREDMFNIIFKS